ncbi:MAG: hypothetical protein AAGB46_18030 [Verrucomicrobiota bacterium]
MHLRESETTILKVLKDAGQAVFSSGEAVSALDFMLTFYVLAGAKPSAGLTLDGVDISPLFRGRDDRPGEASAVSFL